MKNDLCSFLAEAKKQTYANKNIKKSPSSRIGSFDYEYSNGQMTYHDTYFGGTKFIGEEIVYDSDNSPVWGMNYYGTALNEFLGEDAIDNALRPALMRVGEDKSILPLRGPKEYINGKYRYTFEVNGDLDCFNGTETIYCNNEKIYISTCCGGIIK